MAAGMATHTNDEVFAELQSLWQDELLEPEERAGGEDQGQHGQLLSLQICKETLSNLQKDVLLEDSAKGALSKVTPDEVMDRFAWLNQCRGKDSWQKFHSSLLAWSAEGFLTGPLRSFMALSLMQAIQSSLRAPDEACGDVPAITDFDETVLANIAGYLLHKFKLKYVNDVQRLTATNDERVPSEWINLLSRGGLTTPTFAFFSFVRMMEESFRSVDSKSDFISVAVEKSPNFFLELAIDEQFICDAAALFYKVRIHQKCRNLIENHVKLTSKPKKVRPLRDVLSH